MFKYAYLNNNHPEESMEPKSKKPKIGKMVKIDPSVIEKYHINYNQIQQKHDLQGSPLQTPTKIPILLSNGKPVVAGRDITIRPFVPKGEVMTNTHLQKSSIPIPTSSKQLQLPDTSAKTIFFVKPGTTNISSKAQTGSVSSTYLSSNISPRLQEQKLNMSNATNQMNQTSIKKQCNLRSDIEDTVPKYTSVNAGDIFLDNVQPIRCNAVNRSGETKLIGSSQFDGEQITEPTDEENGPVQLADLLAKVDIIDKKVDKLSINVDKKLDALNLNGATQKRLLGDIIAEFAEFKERTRSLGGESGPSHIYFPVANQEALQNLETLSRQKEYADALRLKFLKESTKDSYEFLRANIDHLFTHTSRYTWSGKIAKNAKHTESSLKACELNIVRILIESAMERFKIGRDVCVSQMKKALQNFNAAVHMQHVRQSSAANAFETAVDS